MYLWCISLQGQPTIVLAHDSIITPIQRTISSQKLEDYKSQSEYNFDDNPEYESNLLSRLWMAFKNWLKSILGEDNYNKAGNSIYYILMAIAAAALLYYLFRVHGYNRGFSREERSQTITTELVDETSSLQTIDDLILQAETNQEYRVAIRLLYLKTLKLLDNATKIKWRQGKTNHDYLVELKDITDKEIFDDLIYIYEYSWYGQFDIESLDQYQQLRSPFHNYHKIMK